MSFRIGKGAIEVADINWQEKILHLIVHLQGKPEEFADTSAQQYINSSLRLAVQYLKDEGFTPRDMYCWRSQIGRVYTL
jgi:ribosomal protein S15P/S13E